MFALRGIAVSLTFFVLLYCLFSGLVAVTWRSLKWLRATPQVLSTLLFALRIFPLAASIVITFVFVVPSFQILEPRSVDEGMGTMPLTLGICALLLIGFGCFRVISAQARTSRVVARWLEGALPLNKNAAAQTPTFQSRRETPPLTLVGVHHPRVLVSESTLALMTESELQIALKHELAHMQSHDNLKKLLFRFCPFPGMSKLESASSHTAELAANDAAVSQLDDEIDLAAALVKLSRILPVEVAPICTTGFVTGSIVTRVTRLLAWDATGKVQLTRIRPWYAVPPVFVSLLFIIVTYSQTLALTHEVTEWLVR